MKENKLHINSIHSAFSNRNVKAPTFVWKNLDKALEKNSDDLKINRAFSDVKSGAPQQVWSDIKKQLIIDEVWTNIEITLENEKKKRIFFYINSGVALFALLIFLLFYSENEHRLPYKAKLIDNKGLSGSEISNKNFENLNINSGGFSQKTCKPIITVKETISPFQNNEKTQLLDLLERAKNSELILSSNGKFEMPLIAKTIDIEDYTQNKKQTIQLNRPEIEIIPFQSGSKHNYFEIGFTSAINNTWIFNNDVKSGLRKYSLIDNRISIGQELGLLAFYNFNIHHTIGIEADILSVLNQNYSSFESGQYNQYNIHIKQYKFDFSYRYKTLPIGKHEINLSSGIGISAAMNYTTQKLSSDVLISENTLRNFDFGIKTNFGISKKIKSLNAECGIQIYSGLINLNNSLNQNLNKFNFTTSFLTGFYLNISYDLKK